MGRRSDRQLFIDNIQIYNYYYERLINMALSQFEWENLPGTCDRLYFEKMLLFKGTAAMYKPEGLDDWVSTGYLQTGNFDLYGYPQNIVGVTFNAQSLPTEEWMVLYDNMTKKSILPQIDLYAKLLWEAHMSFRSNLQQQITPYIVTTTRNESLSIKNIFNRIMGFQPVVEVKNSFDPNSIKTLDLKVPFNGEQHLSVLRAIWAEALTMLGISPRTDKRERMVVDEARFNQEENIIALNSRMLNRKEFCRKMNEKFKLDLEVRVSSFGTEFIPYVKGVDGGWQSTPSEFETFSEEQTLT